ARAAGELARAEQLDHGRPRAAPWSLGPRPPDDRAPEALVLCAFPVERELRAGLELDERIRGQDLAQRDEGFEDRGAGAEAVVLVTRGQDDLAGDAEDRADGEAVEQRELDAERDVALAAGPVAGVALAHAERHRELPLVARAEPLLVDELVHPRAGTLDGEDGREDELVFRVRLLGDLRARQVELAARPPVIAAERADVVHHALELIHRERGAERGHQPAEPADRTALVRDGDPVRVRLAGCEAAVGEVGERYVEPDERLRRAGAVHTVACGARGPVQLFAAPGLLRDGVAGRVLRRSGRGEDPGGGGEEERGGRTGQ